MMKNKYKIDGDVLIVYNRKDDREMLFDAEDFDLINKHSWHIEKNKETGYEYVATSIAHSSYKKASRLLMNEPVGVMIDHENGNTADNRKSNLRIADNQINQHNRHSAKGYYWNKKDKRWKAQITINKKHIHLGNYKTEDEARQAYLKAKAIYHPTAPIHLYK